MAGPQPAVLEKHLLRGCEGPSSASTAGIQLNSLLTVTLTIDLLKDCVHAVCARHGVRHGRGKDGPAAASKHLGECVCEHACVCLCARVCGAGTGTQRP